MTRRKQKQRFARWWWDGIGGYTSMPKWRGLKRKVGKNRVLPRRWSTEYLAKPRSSLVEPQVRTPVGKRRERRGQGKPR